MRTRTKEARTKLAAVKTASRPEVKKTPVLPKTLDLIADAVGDMLTIGTKEKYLDHLLMTALSHTARRGYERGIGLENEDEVRKGIDIQTRRYFTEWKIDVMAAWRHSRKKSAVAVEPKTVADQIRARVRETLEEGLERFLGSATPEELRFMSEVLNNYWSISMAVPDSRSTEFPIGQAFAWELGRDDAYLCVPENLRKQVEEYVRALIAVEDRAA